VRDSSGLTSAVTRDILPKKVKLTLGTNIPGLSLTLDGQPTAAPLAIQAVAGMTRTLGAPATQHVSGKSYVFVSWSDGGSSIHTITTPETDTSYTAMYREILQPAGSVVPVIWTNLVNAAVTGTTLRKTTSCDGCSDSAAASQQVITGDGYVEFVVTQTGTQRTIGLSNGNPGTTAREIRFGLTLVGRYVEARENDVYKADVPYAAGDVFRISVASSRVTFSKNGIVFYTSSSVATYPLLVDTALTSTNATLSDVVIKNN
jgi:hypothetical protein